MFAITAARFSPEDPLAGLELGERPDPEPLGGWEVVRVRAAALNHHDLWTLRGVGIREDRLPVVLGCDAAGVTADGREVVVHAVVAGDDGAGPETPDAPFSILSERFDGTHAELVAVPARNLLGKPDGLSFAEAACLPTAWLTAYRMLFTQAGIKPGDRVLVQGAGGGVATAAIVLGRAAGLRVYVTSRDEAKRERAEALGARAAFEPGARLPERVEAVLETVGEATWSHSLRALEAGGTIVVSGATTGPNPPADLSRVFFRQLRIVGSTMGTRGELAGLIRLLDNAAEKPLVDSTFALADGREAYARLAHGDQFGKIVLTVD
jgi:NADPH:quinone reductase-like Zn-dependent oxidoreductase